MEEIRGLEGKVYHSLYVLLCILTVKLCMSDKMFQNIVTSP
jgi:hypothetical protein